MKKFICLLMVALLVMAMSVASFARAEDCDHCGAQGSVGYNGRSTETKWLTCPAGGTHKVIITYKLYCCDECGEEIFRDEVDREIVCSNCN